MSVDRDSDRSVREPGPDRRRAVELVLGVDASTPPSSLALVPRAGASVEETGPFGRETDGWIVGAIDRVLVSSGRRLGDVDAFVTTVGPGTFTGVRVGIATALGLSTGLETQAVGVDTLLALAASAALPVGSVGPVLACLDARRGEVYASWFDSLPTSLQSTPRWGPEVLKPEDVAERIGGVPRPFAIGSGISVAPELEELVDVVNPAITVAAAAARLTLATEIDMLRSLPSPRPRYLRRPDARPGRNPLTGAAPGRSRTL